MYKAMPRTCFVNGGVALLRLYREAYRSYKNIKNKIMNKTQAQQSQKQQIKIADNIPGAEYANLMQINHNKDEFMMVFANVAGPSGKVVSKIISTPGHMKRIMIALQGNIKKYEEQFGEISEAGAPGKEIGFKG